MSYMFTTSVYHELDIFLGTGIILVSNIDMVIAYLGERGHIPIK